MDARLEPTWAAIDPQRLRRTLLEMVDIYSPSGKGEDIQLYLEERLFFFYRVIRLCRCLPGFSRGVGRITLTITA